MNQDELSRYMIMVESYKEQIAQLETQYQYLLAAIADYQKAKMTLEQLGKADDGSEVLLPIGGSTFLCANAKDTTKVLFDIGSGIVAEKSADDAIKKIDERIKNLEDTQEKLTNMIQQFQMEAAEASQKAQSLMAQQQG